MANIDKTVVVLPCHAIEDFPGHETGENAASLLANWTAPWHPSLIALTGNIPEFTSQDFLGTELQHALMFVPISCSCPLSQEISDAAEAGSAILLPPAKNHQEIFKHRTVHAAIDVSIDQNLVRDFFALGYAYLQIQLMTRQLRYSTTMNMSDFRSRVVEAARRCTAKDETTTRDALSGCFDQLLEERNNYYPADPQLINMVLSPPSANLGNQLQREHRFNVLASGTTLEKLATDFPDQLKALQRLHQEKRISVAASPKLELPIQLVGIESVLNQYQRGIETHSTHGISSRTAASYNFGLSTQLPNLLQGLAIDTALHISLTGGKIPTTSAPVINWQGLDGSVIQSFAGTPIDANAPDGFLGLAVTIGEMLDSHHHCDLMFVHWPGRCGLWFELLIAIEKYGPLFGSFVTLDEFNETVHDNGFQDSFSPEDYQFPYLETAVTAGDENPISKWPTFWRNFSRLNSLRTLLTVLVVTSKQSDNSNSMLSEINNLQDQLETNCQCSAGLDSVAAKIDAFTYEQMGLQEIWGNQTEFSGTLDEDRQFFNPSLIEKTVQHFDNQGAGQSIQLPAFSISKHREQADDFVASDDPPVLITAADGTCKLQNEFFVLTIDHNTGGVRSVNLLGKKGNVFTQQLAGRLTDEVNEHGHLRYRSRYTDMRATQVLSGSTSNRLGQIKSLGQIFDSKVSGDDSDTVVAGTAVANFEQEITVLRGCNRIFFSVTLEPLINLPNNPWRNYFANRIAWATEDAMIFRGDHEIADQIYGEKIVSPQFVEIADEQSKFTLLPGGLPFHRRSSRRMLDTLLVTAGEKQTKFSFAVELGAATSIRSAKDYLTPLYMLGEEARKSEKTKSLNSGWVFHLNYKNIIVTNLEPVFDEQNAPAGVRLRMQETQGRSGELKLRCPFEIAAAIRCNFLGDEQHKLKTDGDAALCKFTAYQFFQTELYW